MTKVALALALCFIAGAARASPVAYVGGTGPPNVLTGDPEAVWSEPPDLNGLIASSEQILAFGLESEIANDFVADSYYGIGQVTFWGGYYNNSTPCSAGITTPGFNLKFYSDGGCAPSSTTPDVAWIVATSFSETSVGCQQGVFPMFKWDIYNVSVNLTAGNVYWFGGQVLDHAFPPQGGRLAAASVTGCDSVFRSVYFGYPDWTPGIDVFGVSFDASQEFNTGGIGIDDNYPGACCLPDGECQYMWGYECDALHGVYHGDNSSCNSYPCDPTPTKSTTWGAIKSSYR